MTTFGTSSEDKPRPCCALLTPLGTCRRAPRYSTSPLPPNAFPPQDPTPRPHTTGSGGIQQTARISSGLDHSGGGATGVASRSRKWPAETRRLSHDSLLSKGTMQSSAKFYSEKHVLSNLVDMEAPAYLGGKAVVSHPWLRLHPERTHVYSSTNSRGYPSQRLSSNSCREWKDPRRKISFDTVGISWTAFVLWNDPDTKKRETLLVETGITTQGSPASTVAPRSGRQWRGRS